MATDFSSTGLQRGWMRRCASGIATAMVCGVLWSMAQAAEPQAPIAIRPDSPASYVVQQGDTLWDIAGRFLEQPWLWPQVWQVNPQIQNPDLIYPGDTITLQYVDGQPVLTLNRDGSNAATAPQPALAASSPAATDGIRTERRSPQIRRESLLSPIPALSLERINSFLSENSVVGPDALEQAPYLLGEREGRLYLSAGNEVFARGTWTAGVITYDIVRQGREFVDPDTGDLLGVEALKIGTATITGYNDDRAVLHIDSSLQEARVGDRLIPSQGLTLDPSYLPRPPNFDVNAAIVSIGTGKIIGGQYDTLILNQGSTTGLATGQLLTVQQPSVVVEDNVGRPGVWNRVLNALGATKKGGKEVEYPGENIASVLIYRVYDHASLGLVLSSTENISIKDRVVTP